MDERLTDAVEKIVGHIKDQIIYENDGRVDEVLAELEEVVFVLDACGCGKFIDEIKYQIKVLCDKDDKCPECLGELETVTEKEVHYHLDDKPVEVLVSNRCTQCGWNNLMD